MKFIGHRIAFVFAAAAAFFALAGKGDDAVGVMSIDAGTNGVVEAAMPFNAVDGNGPSDFISGFFMGDGSIFSDRLYRFPADSGNEPVPDFEYYGVRPHSIKQATLIDVVLSKSLWRSA